MPAAKIFHMGQMANLRRAPGRDPQFIGLEPGRASKSRKDYLRGGNDKKQTTVMAEDVRMDKYLWSVRIFKTRSEAAEACKKGKVKIDGMAVKPSREVKVGDVMEVRKNPITHRFRVLALLDKRVGAKLVPEYLSDLTPQEELDKLALIRESQVEARKEDRSGRPTKKDRRDLDSIFD